MKCILVFFGAFLLLSARLASAVVLTVTANLAVWLDASDIDGDGQTNDNPANGASIGHWVNKGTLGVGNALTADEEGGDAPIYLTDGGASLGNLPALDFDGNSSGLKIADNNNLDATNGLTIFIVSNYEGSGFRFGQKGPLTGTTVSDWFISPNSGLGVAGTWQAPPYTDGGGTHIFESIFDPGSGATGGILNLLDGGLRGPELQLGSAYSSPNSNPLYLGRRYYSGGTQGWLNGQIAEILIYNTVLVDEDRNAVGFYLENKYGISTTYIPEPASTTLLLAGAALLLRRRRSFNRN